MARLLMTLPLFIGLTSCAFLERHPDSGYSNPYQISNPGYEQLIRDRARHQEELAYEELGWAPNRNLTPEEAKAVEHRLMLKGLESRLATEREKRQYYNYKGEMLNDEERIQFLRLPTVESRESWASNRSLGEVGDGYSNDIATLIEKNDVAVGMSQKAVKESWGDPDVVEVAGDPLYGNQRWRYSKYVPSNEGYQKVDRYLVFEAGRLIGWHTD